MLGSMKPSTESSPPSRFVVGNTPMSQRKLRKGDTPSPMTIDQQLTYASVQASALRASVNVALIAEGLPVDEETIAFIAKKMVEREGVSLRDEVHKLKMQVLQATSNV